MKSAEDSRPMAEEDGQRRLQRLQEVRGALESLHSAALIERAGKIFTIEETLALIETQRA